MCLVEVKVRLQLICVVLAAVVNWVLLTAVSEVLVLVSAGVTVAEIPTDNINCAVGVKLQEPLPGEDSTATGVGMFND